MIQRFQKTNTGRNEKGRSVKIGHERIAFAITEALDTFCIADRSFNIQGEFRYV